MTKSVVGLLQRSLEDLGTPLSDMTFCIVDLETTGLSPAECSITEIGGVKFRGGERLGTFQSLVDPGCGIPPSFAIMAGITPAMLVDAPRIAAVLPSFLEFLGDAVVVSHKVRFTWRSSGLYWPRQTARRSPTVRSTPAAWPDACSGRRYTTAASAPSHRCYISTTNPPTGRWTANPTEFG